jgi:hypothetical protein
MGKIKYYKQLPDDLKNIVEAWLKQPHLDKTQKKRLLRLVSKDKNTNQKSVIGKNAKQKVITDGGMDEVYKSLKKHSTKKVARFIHLAWDFTDDLQFFLPIDNEKYTKNLGSISSLALELCRKLDALTQSGITLPLGLDNPLELIIQSYKDDIKGDLLREDLAGFLDKGLKIKTIKFELSGETFSKHMKKLAEKHYIDTYPPLLSDSLHTLAELALKESINEPTYWWSGELKGPLPHKKKGNTKSKKKGPTKNPPTDKTPFDKKVLIQNLSKAAKHLFGKYLDQVVATTARVALDLETDIDKTAVITARKKSN